MNIGCILIIIGSRGLLEVFIKLLFFRGKLEIKIARRLNASVIRKSYFVNSGSKHEVRIMASCKRIKNKIFNETSS